MMQACRGWIRVQFFILGIMILLTITAQAEDAMPVLPPDSLVVVAVKKLMKEEKTERLCILVGNGTEIMNISQSLYPSLKQKYPGFFECAGSDTTFIIGPVRHDKDRGVLLVIRRVLDHEACMYQVKRRGDKWRLTKLPCLVL